MTPNNLETLIIIPTQMEFDAFIKEYNQEGMQKESITLGPLILNVFAELGTGVTLGGLGKAQFAVQTQFCINRISGLERVLCVGAAGGLKEGLNFGDVVVATETVEHDIRKNLGRTFVPRFSSDETILKQFMTLAERKADFEIHFGPVASGDEDIMSDSRKHELRTQTGAIAAAWEGAGAARACKFNHLPFIEIRGISDSANQNTRNDFYNNLELVMSNLAKVTLGWIKGGK